MVTTYYPPYHFGGDAVYVYRLAEALAAAGHDVSVVHSLDAYRLASPEEPSLSFSHHPRVSRYPIETGTPRVAALLAHQFGTPLRYNKRIREIIDGGSFDVIHYHNISLIGGPGVLRIGSAVKLYSTHEYWLVCPTHVLFRYNREACEKRTCVRCCLHSKRPPQIWRYTGRITAALREIDCMLMPSQFCMDRHRSEGIDRKMVLLPLIASPGNPSLATNADRLAPAGDWDRDYFLYVGRLEKLKGVQDLLTIFRDFRKADLVVVGEGNYSEELRRQAADLPHVRFVGAVHPAELAPMYSGACAVLVPSLCYETFGLTAAEALASGIPAIVRRHGALTEMIAESDAGLAFGDLEECREAMDSLLSSPQKRAAMGERGREFAARRWSVEAHLEAYLSVIEQELNRRVQHAP